MTAPAPAHEREVQTVSQERKRRTRSRTTSHLDPIVISRLPAHEYDLDPACISLVCPSCRTWVPIRVADTERATAKLLPHHTEPAGTEDPARCRLGSHRLVTIDVNVATWSRRLEQGVAETNGRRADRVIRKPQARPTPAVMQLVGGLVDDKTARKLNEIHVHNCTTCSATKPRCADGRRLAAAAPKLVSAHLAACSTCAPAKARCADARSLAETAPKLLGPHLATCTTCAPATSRCVAGHRLTESAPKLVHSHVAICTTCSLAESRCADGRRLAHLAAHTQRTAPLRRQRQTEQEEQADQRAWALRLLRDQQWDRVAGRVHQADQQRVRDVLTALRKMLLAPAKAGDTPLTTWERADLETTIAVLERQEKDLTHRW
ncbi:hypothetical protein ACTFBT_38195 [Streptomyces microflavus]|uniref:Uncharacterized protein n=1 Tax=Streptomyces microflavus TaxID=1919 RepID=A0A7J0D6Q2_STRMI|nr:MULTISPECIES: hypothetical protein [Streptomyces]MDX2981609.1 hypothetical protein [Streptomyces sp. NRRL_B-2249]GFN09777.1 hypothetical protein Smic_83330 [Streptomyces microflavus]GGX94691.1 hypothetical protein GCM10010298_70080 [Streptomyces microflavus]